MQFGFPREDTAGDAAVRTLSARASSLTPTLALTSSPLSLYLSLSHIYSHTKKKLWGGRRTICWTGQGVPQREWERGTLNKCVMAQYLPALSVCCCILSRDSLLAVKSVQAPSSVPSLSTDRSLPLSLCRHSAHIAMLFVPGNKKQHLFTEASHIVLPDLLAKTCHCNHLCNNREPEYFFLFVLLPVLQLLVQGQIWLQRNNKHTKSNMTGA